MNLNTQTYESLSSIFSRDFSSLLLLPKIEKLINKQEPTLEDVLGLCSHNESLLLKLTRRAGFGSNEDEFAKEILFKKGLSFLKSLAIRTMNQEIFSLPLKLEGMTEYKIKRRAVILARFIKHFNELLGIKPDDAYLCGLFYNFSYVSYEKLIAENLITVCDFEEVKDNCIDLTSTALKEIGFDPVITSFIEDSNRELHSTKFPFGHALSRIGNTLLINSEDSISSNIGRGSGVDRQLLDATGLTTREIINVLKELTRDYKGGVGRQ